MFDRSAFISQIANYLFLAITTPLPISRAHAAVFSSSMAGMSVLAAHQTFDVATITSGCCQTASSQTHDNA